MGVPGESMVLWAMRDILRRPGDALMTAGALALTTLLLAIALLLTQAVADTARRVLTSSPDVVIRRVNAGGWAPIPIRAAAASLRSVPGVVEVRPRVWGAAATDGGPVTLVGVAPGDRPDLPGGDGIPPLSPGQAVIGPGVRDDGGRLSVGRGPAAARTFSIAGRLPRGTGLVAHDLVMVDFADAWPLLDIPQGFASDMAVSVFHPEEAEAIVPDLAAALPFPARITTRTEAGKHWAGSVFRRGSLAVLAMLPAIFALLLLVALTVRERVSRPEETGLLKALGWLTGDLVRLQALRAGVIGIPGILAGLFMGYWLVFWPGVSWPSQILLGWPDPPPELHLDPSGALSVMAQIFALVFLPYLAAVVGPTLRASLADPLDLLERRR